MKFWNLFDAETSLWSHSRLTIDPPDPDATGAGHSGDDNDFDDEVFDDEGNLIEGEKTPEGQPSSEGSRFKTLADAEKSYLEVQQEKDRISTKNTELERRLQALEQQTTKPPAPQADAPDPRAMRERRALEIIESVNSQLLTEGRKPGDPNYDTRWHQVHTAYLSEVAMEDARREVALSIEQREYVDRASKQADMDLRTALKEAGLEHDGYVDLAYSQMNGILAANPQWTQAVPYEQRIAQLVEGVKTSGFVHKSALQTQQTAQQQQTQQDAFGGSITDGGAAPPSGSSGSETPGKNPAGSIADDMRMNQARMKRNAARQLQAARSEN